jgi:anhydro-N-acetylmuramic acid kinase
MHQDKSKNGVTALGMMSGTSMDGVDIAAILTDGEHILRVGPSATRPYTASERQLLRQANADAAGMEDRNARPGTLAQAEAMITRAHIDAAQTFLAGHPDLAPEISAIGFHGHTVLHRPEAGLTVQIGDGQALAQALGRTVVHDLRAADVAAGGQGAPLVCAYHQALVRASGQEMPAAVLNTGGVANLTWMGAGGELLAFDTGPGNAMIDEWALRHTGEPMDRDGALARRGTVDQTALLALEADERLRTYFLKPPPKSLDRGDFAHSAQAVAHLSPEDGAATLCAFTAHAVALAVAHLPGSPRSWVVSGGGMHNPVLMRELRERVSPGIVSADSIGWKGDFLEAQAFAYLAVRSLRGLPITFPGTTGVSQPMTGGRLAMPQRAA